MVAMWREINRTYSETGPLGRRCEQKLGRMLEHRSPNSAQRAGRGDVGEEGFVVIELGKWRV